MKNIAMYLRLSLSDVDMGENGKRESNSIENQRLLIRSFLSVHPEITGDVIEYKDDGFTGTNFNRPAFRKMIEDAKRGYIGTIVVKDLSRFGRDYIGMGDYIEQILPSLGVRLIAINSRYDSAEQGANIVSLDVSINNMINNMYSRDLSKKLRSAYRAKWNNGENVNRSLPYGYTTDKNDPSCRPIIDEEAAKVVRDIFMLAIEGYSTREISEELNARDIMTPMVYRNKRHGYKMGNVVGDQSQLLWTPRMVATILRRYDYTGARTHGKIEKIGVGLRKTRTRDKYEWIIVENNHEPIVSKKVYDKVQKIVRTPGFRKICNRKNHELLAGKVRCGCCGHVMRFAHDDRIHCQHAMEVGSKSKCNKDYYDAREIENAVLRSLINQIDLVVEVGSALRDKCRIIPSEREAADTMKNKLEKLNEELVRQYENYVNGNLGREGFIAIKGEIAAKREQLESQILEIEQSCDNQERVMFDVDRAVGIGKTINNFSDITREVIDAFIEDIRINNKGEVEIRFMFEDLYAEALKVLQSG